MRYKPTDTTPLVPLYLMRNEGWDLVKKDDGWRVEPVAIATLQEHVITLARKAGLNVDNDGYLLKG